MTSTFVRQYIPPALRQFINRLAGAAIEFRGPYADWDKAQAATVGYDHGDILARIADATSQVLRGRADYEQDGVAMHGSPDPDAALLALLLGASLHEGRLSVLDLGGGLGSHYLKWRTWLTPLPELRWCIVEQPHFVELGKSLFDNRSQICFSSSIQEAKSFFPNAVLASSVLHYLQDPFTMLDALLSLDAGVVVIDRMPFDRTDTARVMAQHVPRRLGVASYPLWVMSRSAVYARLRERYDLLAEFPGRDAPLHTGGIAADYAGSVWLHRK